MFILGLFWFGKEFYIQKSNIHGKSDKHFGQKESLQKKESHKSALTILAVVPISSLGIQGIQYISSHGSSSMWFLYIDSSYLSHVRYYTVIFSGIPFLVFYRSIQASSSKLRMSRTTNQSILLSVQNQKFDTPLYITEITWKAKVP